MTDSDYTYYAFRMCVGAYFEMPTADARDDGERSEHDSSSTIASRWGSARAA